MATRSLSIILIAAALALAAAANTAAAANAAPPAKGELTIAFGAESTTMDPFKYSAGVDLYFVSQISEQLLHPYPDLHVGNWLAESWTVNNNGGKPIIDVHIRRGVKFHNGDALTAADFQFSFEKLRDPKVSRWSHLQANVERFELVDDFHFRLHFKQPDAAYVTGLLQLWAVPKKYYEKVGPDGFNAHPVGTGPWKFVSRSVHEELKLEAFDDYWNKELRPTVKTLIIKIIPEDSTRVAAFQTGAVDWIDAVPPARVEEFKAMSGVRSVSMVTGNNLFLNFDTQLANSPFNDVRVRQAAAYAIDVDAIIKSVLFGQGERYQEVGKGELGYDPGLQPYPYDPAKSRELLKAAGYPSGFDTPCYNLITPREPNMKEMGEATFAYLSAAGIRCKLQGLEYGAWINLGRRGRNAPPEMDGVLSWMWGHGLPGDTGTPWMGHLHSFEAGKGFGSYSYTNNAQMDALVEKLNTAMQPAERAKLIQEIARIKHDQVLGGLTTYRPLVTFAWRADKVAFVPWPPGFWRNMQQIGLKE